MNYTIKRWFKRGFKFLKYVLVSLLLVSILFACSNVGNQPNAPDPTGTNAANRITIGTIGELRTLDPADAFELLSGNILFNTLDRLYTYAPGTTEIVPQLATALPEISADGLTYRIPIREGVKFHDGTDFDATAMAFSLQRFIDLDGSPSFLLDDVESVEATSVTELVIKLKQPLQFFPKLLAFTGAGAISPTAYAESTEFQPNNLVGTGPYQLIEYKEGNVLRLDAFADYWGEKPANAGIDMQFISSNGNLLNAFKTGAVDVAFQTLSPTQIKNIEDNAAAEGWTVTSGQGATLLFMVVNVKQPPLDDVRVRQAIAAAIDRPLLQKRVFLNQRTPVYSMVPITFNAYKPTFQERYGDGNGELARQLLAEAGYSDQNPLLLNLWYPPQYAGSGDLVVSTLKAVIERNLGNIIKVKLDKVPKTTAYAFIEEGAYPTFLLDWIPDFFDPDNFISPFLRCNEADENGCIDGSTKYWGSFYNNEEMNKLIAQQRIEQDPIERNQMLGRIQEILARDVPFIPLWQNKEYAFAGKGIKGVTIEPTQQLPYWSISK
ncbi:ABC-type transporter, periplasmic subunit [Thalassoporum mexicanum PCC 7367]|uniref:ABC transporter substrate-binding protein n=1 Tax=Thalassoporum mexicanum TaxID=3457544 RepID=UPI00029FEE2A|nr:ABC transporter substrate-binding protein [Pseudanabaena sp. PCC 7367]AFY69630.1 ABC-type transporter, periplasmic subunit [Pseudanabaena sp. PCC 7367]